MVGVSFADVKQLLLGMGTTLIWLGLGLGLLLLGMGATLIWLLAPPFICTSMARTNTHRHQAIRTDLCWS
jgi:hypothetical protein